MCRVNRETIPSKIPDRLAAEAACEPVPRIRQHLLPYPRFWQAAQSAALKLSPVMALLATADEVIE